MAKNKKLWLDMCAGSELKDTQGETLSVEGADITDLMMGAGRLNDNHGKGFFNSLGRITEAKKIFKAEDCDNERQKYYWEKIKAPYIYAKGYLYNDEDHPNAKAAAAILKNIHRDDIPLRMKASVEGGVISRGITDPTRLARTKIHSVALTFTPANNATLVEALNINKSESNWETDKQLIKSIAHLAETNIPSFRHIERHASAHTISENIQKIQELAKGLGIEIEIKDHNPELILKNAVFSKISSNVSKINELVKALKSPPASTSFKQNKVTERATREDNYQQKIGQLKADPTTPPKLDNTLQSDKMPLKTGDDFKAQTTLKLHASRALRDENYLTNLHSGLVSSGRVTKEQADQIISGIQNHVGRAKNFKKALCAGYGGAGAPTSMTAGAVLQPESLETSKKKSKKKLKNLKKAIISYTEELVKGKKELLNMYKPEHQETGRQHIEWATSSLPSPWHTWAVKNHRDNPESFTPDIKEQLHHFAGMKHSNDIQGVRFDSKDTFKTGLSKLKTAQEKHDSKKQELANRYVSHDDENMPKIVDGKTKNHAWHDLKTPYSRQEGEAMDHCGNIEGQSRETDNILSLREKRESDHGTHIPHLTFIENNGWIGEAKGYKNSKPSKKFHQDIVELLKNPRMKGIIGGGYKPEANFQFEDLSPEHQKEVLSANPNLITNIKHPDNIDKALSNNLPEHQRAAMAHNLNLDSRHHEKLLNDKEDHIRGIMAENRSLDPKFHEQLVNDKEDYVRFSIARNLSLDPKFHEQLVNDAYAPVRHTMAMNPDLDPKFHEQLVNDKEDNIRENMAAKPDLDPKFHEQLVNDKNQAVLTAIAANPNLDPKHHEKLLHLPFARSKIAANPNLDPKHFEELINDESGKLGMASNPNLPSKFHEKLVSDEDPMIRSYIAANPNLDPKHHEKLLNDTTHFVKFAMAKNPNLDPRHHEKLLNDKEDLTVSMALAMNPNLDPKFHEQLVNNDYLKYSIAKNPSLDPKHQEQLFNNGNFDLKLALAGNPGLDPKYYDALLSDESSEIRDTISENPSYMKYQKKLKKHLIEIQSLYGKLDNLKTLNKSMSYITCDNCGHEQVYMKHQVKCRNCRQNFSLEKLKDRV